MEQILIELFTLAEMRDRAGLEAFINKYITPAKQTEVIADIEVKETTQKQDRSDQAKAEVTKLEAELSPTKETIGVKR